MDRCIRVPKPMLPRSMGFFLGGTTLPKGMRDMNILANLTKTILLPAALMLVLPLSAGGQTLVVVGNNDAPLDLFGLQPPSGDVTAQAE